VRLRPVLRKQEILNAALRLSEARGYRNVTARSVADLSGCAVGLVIHYFGSMQNLEREVMAEAVRVENFNVVAQGLLMSDRAAVSAPESVRRSAANYLQGE
jgi:AcrR family transcriptional regulator